jgi:hypothetical protein
MSWWKWAIPIGAAVAAPFTFGGSLAALGMGGAAAAGTAGASSAATIGGMLGAAGIGAAGNIYGAHAAAKSNDKGAALQAKANADALDFAKQQYAAEEARRAPFRAMANSIGAWQMRGSPMAPPPPGPTPIRAGTIGSLIPRG